MWFQDSDKTGGDSYEIRASENQPFPWCPLLDPVSQHIWETWTQFSLLPKEV